MAFVPEDGTGLANANSYASVAAFQAYWLERGKDLTQYLQGQKESSLVQGTDHIEIFFGPKLYGFKKTSAQALEFPRVCLYDALGTLIEGVPLKVTYALFEYAHLILTTKKPLAPNPEVDPSGLQVQATFKKVGPLEKRVTFTQDKRVTLPPYPKADAYLKEFVSSSGGSYRA